MAPSRSSSRAVEREAREPIQRQNPNKGPLLLTAVLVVIAAGAGGLYYVVQKGKGTEPEPAPPTVIAPPVANPAAPTSTGPVDNPPVVQVESAPRENPTQTDPVPAKDAAQEQAPPPTPRAAAGAAYVWVTPEAGKPIPVPTGALDPALITLELAPPLERWTKTDEKTWSGVQDDLALFLENAGARSNRAGDALVKAGRHAYPALVTAMMKQDWTTNEGVKAAGALNDLVAKIDAATNFTWRSLERNPIGSDKWKEDVTILKKGAIGRYNRWVNVLRTNDGEWENIAKKGGSVGNTVVDEEGNQVGDVPPDLPPDAPPDGR